jgi:UDP-2,4-diacetamido-2,4,6-trideoxy-beta-L-altropyranose hydrolase
VVQQNLCIRADADSRMGTGHLLRCLALAQAWNESGGHTIVLTACQSPEVHERLTAEGIHLELLSAVASGERDAEETLGLARRLEARWVVLDGYHFTADFQRRVRRDGVRLLAIDDDRHASHYAADLVLNPNPHATEQLYRAREPYTQLLLGTRFALLRREFLRWRGWTREVPDTARKVLITLGGSDPHGVSLKAIEALHRVEIPGLEVILVIGPASPHSAELAALARSAATSIQIQRDVKDMAELMAWADIAVAAGGTTTWERAMLGLPSLVIILAENQRQPAEASDRMGIAWNLGWHGCLDAARLSDALRRLIHDRPAREAMSRQGPRWIDGLGASRVVAVMDAGPVALRSASSEDCRLIWEFANEEPTRAASFCESPIPWESHVNWFAQKLEDSLCTFLVATDERGNPVGQVRFDVDGDEATISTSLSSRYHGLGYGATVIRLAVSELLRSRPVRRINAFVRSDNPRSLRTFVNAGFRGMRELMMRGHPAHHLVLDREQVSGGRGSAAASTDQPG